MTGQPTETKRLPKDLRDALPAKARRQVEDLRQGSAGRPPRKVWTLVHRGPRTAPRGRAARLGPAAVPALVLHQLGEPGPIEEATGRLRAPDSSAAVEFRQRSWFNEKNIERTLRFLGDRRIPLVVVDGPQGFKSSVPPIVAAPSPDLAIVRFHGRRAATWEAKGVETVERFRYLYDHAELTEWAPRVRELASQAPTPTSCSTTATRTTVPRTPSSWRNCCSTCKPRTEASRGWLPGRARTSTSAATRPVLAHRAGRAR